jgi:DNA-directed RNA polymerase specialized sigma24 family protein
VEQRRARWRDICRRPAGLGDGALVAALRCEDEGALREFFLRFRAPLLLAARNLRVPPGERDALVDDCLADVAVHLIATAAPPPRSLIAYLTRSLRNRMLNQVRSRARADHRLAEEAVSDGEGAVVTCCSEHALRASGARAEAAPLSVALRGLAAGLEASLDPEQRLLAVWLSHCVPQLEIAAWLELTPKAAAKRIERLRERLQYVALEYLERAPEHERGELLRFLGRAAFAPGPAARFAGVSGAGEEEG